MDISIICTKDFIIYAGLFLAVLILFIWNIVTSAQLSRLKKKYKQFMRGARNTNLEEMIKEYMENIDNTLDKVDVLNDAVIGLKDQADRCIQKCNIIRYNAFSDTGSDLSYSIAMLDNFNNGFVLSSIYGREESVTYAKPIESGKCRYPLSVEEEIVLDRCLKTIIMAL